MNSTNFQIRTLVSLPQIYLLVCTVFTYLLGTAAANYLGEGIDWGLFSNGLIVVLFIQAAIGLTHTYFRLATPSADNQPPSTTAELEMRKMASYILLGSVAALFTAVTLMTFSMYQNGYLHSQLILVLVIGIVLALAVVLPPIRLILRGYGELLISIIICVLVPFVGFFLQSNGSAQILSISIFPLTTLFLASLVALEFEGYGQNCLYCHPNMLVKLGWVWGGKIHSILILASYLLIGIGYLNGLPWRIVSPFLLTVLLAFLQIYLLNRIMAGDKPAWRLLNASAAATFLLAAYLVTYSFWMV